MITKKEIQMFHETNRILQQENDYIYMLPHPLLRNEISNYTITFPNKDIISDCYTVIPHGCGTLVFSYDRSGLHSDLFGPLTKPCVVGGFANQCDMIFIIEFQPAGLYGLTGVNQKELANQTIPFEMINPILNKGMMETLEHTRDLDDLIACLDQILLKNFYRSYPSALSAANKIIVEHVGNISNKKLSDSVYYSQRHLNRMFEQYLGMNTKTFSRLIRINKAIRLMQNSSRNITGTSYEAGFYDLPHFIHDFKSVCGMTPQEYRNNMSDFYSEIAKF